MKPKHVSRALITGVGGVLRTDFHWEHEVLAISQERWEPRTYVKYIMRPDQVIRL